MTDNPRPAWTHTLRRYLSEDILDAPSYQDAHDPVLERIEEAVNDILCDVYGHEVIFDQCLIPEHRYCVYCGRRESTIASRSPALAEDFITRALQPGDEFAAKARLRIIRVVWEADKRPMPADASFEYYLVARFTPDERAVIREALT